jgi:hypothetical protein
MNFLLSHAWVGWAVAVGGWLFSGAMSTMPPLPKDAGYLLTWSHDFLQWAAANWPKRQRTTDPDPAKG